MLFRNKNLEAAKDALRLDLMKLRRSAIKRAREFDYQMMKVRRF